MSEFHLLRFHWQQHEVGRDNLFVFTPDEDTPEVTVLMKIGLTDKTLGFLSLVDTDTVGIPPLSAFSWTDDENPSFHIGPINGMLTFSPFGNGTVYYEAEPILRFDNYKQTECGNLVGSKINRKL